MDWTKRIVAGLLALALTPGFAGAQASPRAKKLIISGWDMPSTGQLRRGLPAMESLPFDGTSVWLTPTVPLPAGYNGTPARTAFSRQPWKREWYSDAIDDLKAVRAARTRLTDNFLRLNANPGDVDWFDDAGWKEIVDHFRIAAWVAKEGGAKGILFDPEPYTKPWRAFDYNAQPEAGAHTFEEYAAKARQRGREVMAAMAAEYPDITVFTFFMNSIVVNGHPSNGPSPAGRSEAGQARALFLHGFGLYPAFIDGWLDALPPTARLVDGDEGGYRYATEEKFHTSAAMIKGAGQDVVSPENRARYRAQVQAGVAVYMDAHIPGSKNGYELPGAGAGLLGRNVASALGAVDEYVWLYGEEGRWWPAPEGAGNGATTYPSWERVLPGATAAVRDARDPAGAVEREARRELDGAAPANVIDNGDFSKGAPAGHAPANPATDGVPAGWGFWRGERSEAGRCDWDGQAGAMRISHTRTGAATQVIPVRPGERYYASARTRTSGKGLPSWSFGWKGSDGAWLASKPSTLVIEPLRGPEKGGGWSEWGAVVVVPEGAARMVVTLGVEGQFSDADEIWWDDVRVVRLP